MNPTTSSNAREGAAIGLAVDYLVAGQRVGRRQPRAGAFAAAVADAPGFDRDRWPEQADMRWQQQVHQHFGATPHGS